MYTRKQIEEMLEEAPYKIQIKSIEIIRQLLDELDELKKKVEGMRELEDNIMTWNDAVESVLALFKEE